MEIYREAEIENEPFGFGFTWYIPRFYDVSEEVTGHKAVYGGGHQFSIKECKNDVDEFWDERAENELKK